MYNLCDNENKVFINLKLNSVLRIINIHFYMIVPEDVKFPFLYMQFFSINLLVMPKTRDAMLKTVSVSFEGKILFMFRCTGVCMQFSF